MSENDNKDAGKNSKKKDSISIIYHQKNDSPKYFEIKRSKVYLFFIGLPTITLIALTLGVIGILNTSPMQLAKNYRANQDARNDQAQLDKLEDQVKATLEENEKLKQQLTESEEIKTAEAVKIKNEASVPGVPAAAGSPSACPAPVACPAPPPGGTANSIGLSTLSLFRPIQGQKDRTRPAVINLSGFKTAIGRDTVNLQFNIIPAVTDDSKISGHIIVLMKNELAIQTYPLQALGGSDFQINYSAGEPFSTQRFRPVDASFVKPRKSGNYSFTVFIFSRSGDLIHFQTMILPLRL